LLFILILIGETFAPSLSQYAENERSYDLDQIRFSGSQDGFWIRDGDNFINVENNIDGSMFNGITIIEVNKENKIHRVIRSDSGVFNGQSFNLNETDIFSVDSNNTFENINLKERNKFNKNVAFDQDLIASLEKEPKDLSTFTILNQIQFLKQNKLRASIFEVELYNRLAKPLSLIAMILLAMLFIFGSNRDITLGRKIFFGVAIGLSFELITRLAEAISLSYEFSPFWSSFSPSLLVIIIAISILVNKSRYS